MSCISSPRTFEGMVKMIEDCAIAYGGPGWVSLAMMGLAVVLMAILLIITLFWLLRVAAR
jgi:hypothetical protein